MKTFLTFASLTCSLSAYADIVPYNLCAHTTKTDCEALHMPSLGIIDSSTGHKTFSCDTACSGCAPFKAIQAVSLLAPQAGDFNYSHFITFEINENNIVYIQPNQNEGNTFERIIAHEENNLLILKYCSFSTDNIVATLEKYKKDYQGKNVQAGKSLIKIEAYNNLKTAFQAQEDASFCEDLK